MTAPIYSFREFLYLAIAERITTYFAALTPAERITVDRYNDAWVGEGKLPASVPAVLIDFDFTNWETFSRGRQRCVFTLTVYAVQQSAAATALHSAQLEQSLKIDRFLDRLHQCLQGFLASAPELPAAGEIPAVPSIGNFNALLRDSGASVFATRDGGYLIHQMDYRAHAQDYSTSDHYRYALARIDGINIIAAGPNEPEPTCIAEWYSFQIIAAAPTGFEVIWELTAQAGYTQYIVRRKLGSGPYSTIATIPVSDTLDPETNLYRYTHTDNGIAPGTYTYTVIATGGTCDPNTLGELVGVNE